MKALTLVRKAVRFELGLWKSLYRWVFRRPRVSEPGAKAFTYASVVTPVLVGITVVSLIEIPVLHLLLPWQGVRVVLFLLGVQTLFWMLGLLASYIVHPHVIGASGLRIRYSSGLDFTLDWAQVESVRTRLRSLSKNRTVQHDGDVLCVGVASQTNIDVVLRGPTVVPLFWGQTSEPFSELRFYADNPASLLAEARERIAEARANAPEDVRRPLREGPADASLGELRDRR